MRSVFLFNVLIIPVIFFNAGLLAQRPNEIPKPCPESMSSAERDKLGNPEEGKLIFNTTSGCFNYYQSKKWRVFCENKKGTDDNVRFDESTGVLKYKINGRWFTFAMTNESPEEDGEGVFFTKSGNSPPGESTSKLPDDCQRKPTRPYAGRDLVSFDYVDLEANIPSHGKGYWSIVQGDGGHFVDSTVPNTRFSGIQGTTYYLHWTIATQCDTLFDEALVRIRPPCDPEPSQSFAGTDQLNVESAKLNGNSPREGNGGWMIVSGLGGYLENPKDPKTTFRGVPGETYVLRWIIRNECGLTQDDVIIKMKPPCRPEPSISNAGDDQIDVEKCLLHANRPEFGTGKWSIAEGRSGRFENSDSSNSRFYGLPGESYVLQWTITTACGSTSDRLKVKFSSHCPEEVIDTRDGNKYRAIRLAKQCWIAQNLNYRPEGIEASCYDALPSYCDEFGALYTWKAVMDGESKEKSKGICPKGWHVPSDKEWQHLIDSSGYRGIELLLGGKSGFNVPMGGSRYTNGKFLNRNEYAYYWSSTAKDDNTAWNRYFPNKSNSPDHYATDKRHSFSVRCVKDED